MKAQSADYIVLQNVYRDKARRDLSEVLANVRRLEQLHGRKLPIHENAIEGLCKNAGFLKLIRGHPLRIGRDAKIEWGNRAEFARQQLLDSESLFPLHIAFLAYDVFRSTSLDPNSEGRAEADRSELGVSPGAHSDDIPRDTKAMTAIAHHILEDLWAVTGGNFEVDVIEHEGLRLAQKRTTEYVRELVRAGGSELHNISALTGGMVAQEIIKIITKQYIPIDNVCLFDGAASKAQELKL